MMCASPRGMAWWRMRAAPFLKELVARVLRDQVFDYAADLAFWSLLALFPFGILVLTLLGYLPVHSAAEHLYAELPRVMPPQAAALVERTVREVVGRQRGWLLVVSLLGTLWSSSSGMSAAAVGLGRAFGLPDRRPWWRGQLLSISMTLGTAVLVIVMGVAAVIGPGALRAVGDFLGAGTLFDSVWAVVRWPILVVAALALVACMYAFLPDFHGAGLPRRWRPFSAGALTAVTLWMAATVLFNLYLRYLHTYAKTYGALGAVIVLMLWLFLGATAILVGAEVDAIRSPPLPAPTDGEPRGGPEPTAPPAPASDAPDTRR